MTTNIHRFCLFFLLLTSVSCAYPECPIIGIDLGTTYSSVGVFTNGRVKIIPNQLGHRLTPSVVAFTDEKILIGEPAKDQAINNPTNTIYNIKRLMGHKFDDEDVEQVKKLVPFEVINKGNKPYIRIQVKGETKTYSPEEISAMILRKMKEDAEVYLGQEITHAIITVPAYFNDAQRQAAKDAGTIAGLKIVRVINEPTAAAIAYGLNQKSDEKNILVFDLGGGTFDVSILTIDSGVFEVIAASGGTHLVGEDFDQRVLDHYLELIKKKYNVDLNGDKSAVHKLKREVEKAKRILSSDNEAKIEVENLVSGEHLSETLTRDEFEKLNGDLFDKTLIHVQKVLDDACLNKTQIHEFILVGGSTRIPKIQQLIKTYFGGKEIIRGINPDEVGAFGAAVEGGILCGKDLDEDVGCVFSLDKTELTLGIETFGGIMAKIIPRGTHIPTKKSRIFTTHQDNQETFTVRIFEGERPLTKNNHFLGELNVSSIPLAPKGVPQIEVTFEVDYNGILHFSASTVGTNKTEVLTVTSDEGRLSQEEIDNMLKEAEEFAEEDRALGEKANAKYNLERFIYQIAEDSNDPQNQDKISNPDREIIHKALQEARDCVFKNDEASENDYAEKERELEKIWGPIVEKIYSVSDDSSLLREGDSTEL